MRNPSTASEIVRPTASSVLILVLSWSKTCSLRIFLLACEIYDESTSQFRVTSRYHNKTSLVFSHTLTHTHTEVRTISETVRASTSPHFEFSRFHLSMTCISLISDQPHLDPSVSQSITVYTITIKLYCIKCINV